MEGLAVWPNSPNQRMLQVQSRVQVPTDETG